MGKAEHTRRHPAGAHAPVCHGAHGVGVDRVDASKHLGLGDAAAIHQQLTANGLGHVCRHRPTQQQRSARG